MVDIQDKDFYRLTDFIRLNYGIDLSHKKTLIEYRLATMLMEKEIKDFSAYFDEVINESSKREITEILNRLTTNHTFFMREADHYKYLQEQLLRHFELKLTDRDLRVWSAGCSTGEEAYTLAMVVDEYFKESHHLWDTKILATDIAVNALNTAEQGVYSEEAIKDLPPLWKMNYFKKNQNNKYEIADKIKNEVIFRVFNLMDPHFPFKKKFHIIFCRNVMIYFDPLTREELVNKFYHMTEPGGFLFIGHSETIDRSKSDYIYVKPSIYRKGLD